MTTNISGDLKKFVEILKSGGLGIVPTDTIYGISASAFSIEAVERVYSIKKRRREKPLIILISKIDELERFGISFDGEAEERAAKYWPGRNSLIFNCLGEKFSYLTGQDSSLAFRVPEGDLLREFLDLSGPLVSTSANPEGEPPAKNIEEARKYFQEAIDFYWDRGELSNPPSKVIDMRGNDDRIIRR